MSRIRGKETKPELLTRKALHARGYRYRLHVRSLPGRPDIVLPKHRAAIFVHGCFWHRHDGCALAYRPKSNTTFWLEKFSQNVERDRRQLQRLREMGWRTLVVWECVLRSERERPRAIRDIMRWIESRSSSAEIPIRPLVRPSG